MEDYRLEFEYIKNPKYGNALELNIRIYNIREDKKSLVYSKILDVIRYNDKKILVGNTMSFMEQTENFIEAMRYGKTAKICLNEKPLTDNFVLDGYIFHNYIRYYETAKEELKYYTITDFYIELNINSTKQFIEEFKKLLKYLNEFNN
jgi:hypothetical protein